MRLVHIRLLALACVLGTAGCGGSDPVVDEAEGATALPSLDNVAGARDGVPSADGAPPQDSAAAPTPGALGGAAVSIPAALHGQWGMTPGDCDATPGGAKGLLIVSAAGLRFHESAAVPVANVETSADSISADFAFTGEGRKWSKYQALSLDDDRLVRTESSPMASFTYARCR